MGQAFFNTSLCVLVIAFAMMVGALASHIRSYNDPDATAEQRAVSTHVVHRRLDMVQMGVVFAAALSFLGVLFS